MSKIKFWLVVFGISFISTAISVGNLFLSSDIYGDYDFASYFKIIFSIVSVIITIVIAFKLKAVYKEEFKDDFKD